MNVYMVQHQLSRLKMTALLQGPKEAICQKCGDKGYSEALICCSECKNSFEHRYCLDNASDIFKEDLTWTCAECASKKHHKQRCLHRVMDSRQWRSNRASQVAEANVESKEQKEVPAVAKVALEKSNIISCDDLRNVSAKNGKRGVSPVEGKVSQSEKTVCDFLNGVLVGSSCPRNDIQTIDGEAFGFSYEDCYVYALPLLEPTWRGSFRTRYKQFGIVESLTAHLSTKACIEVWNEACLLPRIIQLDVLTRRSVWPNSFLRSRPTDNSVALYFFPQRRDNKSYYSLVDAMIMDDLAMRSEVENAELLVFTSIELPMKHWKFEGKHYLWGVFRVKQNGHTTFRKQSMTKGTNN